MTELELQVEIERVKLAYAEKLNGFDAQLSELDVKEADLTMEAGELTKQRARLHVWKRAMILERNREIHNVKERYISEKKEV